jgi:hypothetical protein
MSPTWRDLGADEIGPGRGRAFGSGVDPGFPQDLPYRRRRYLHPEHEQFTVHAPIPPPGVLPDQAQHQDADGTHGRRPTPPRGSAPGSVPPFDQVAVPTQHRVGTDQQPHPAKRLGSQPVQQCRQQSPVRRSEPDLPFAQLAFQYGNLVAQDQDLGVLVPIARGKKTHERERVRHRQVGQSQQHSRSSCRDDRLAAAVPSCTRATKPRTWSHRASCLSPERMKFSARTGPGLRGPCAGGMLLVLDLGADRNCPTRRTRPA